MNNGYQIIENVLDKYECDILIKLIDDLFTQNPDPDGLEIDGYNRLKISNPNITNMLTQKLNVIIDMNSHYIHHQWFSTKYIIGGGLAKHYDGHTFDDNNTSSYTLLVYLNDNFEGGSTTFTESGIKIQPTQGMVLILDQNIEHEAEGVTNGFKYILRGDIFKK